MLVGRIVGSRLQVVLSSSRQLPIFSALSYGTPNYYYMKGGFRLIATFASVAFICATTESQALEFDKNFVNTGRCAIEHQPCQNNEDD